MMVMVVLKLLVTSAIISSTIFEVGIDVEDKEKKIKHDHFAYSAFRDDDQTKRTSVTYLIHFQEEDEVTGLPVGEDGGARPSLRRLFDFASDLYREKTRSAFNKVEILTDSVDTMDVPSSWDVLRKHGSMRG